MNIVNLLSKDDFFKSHKLMYLTYGGSYAYGTNVETSDIDYRGFFLEDLNTLLSNANAKDIYDKSDPDITVYSFKKICHLLTNCNPNVIELLGTKEEHCFIQSEASHLLRENLHLFLSKKAYVTFAGYAYQQLQRLSSMIKNDNEINNQQTLLQSIKKSLLHDDMNIERLDPSGFFTPYIENDQLLVNIKLSHISLKEFSSKICNLHATINQFDKINHRNRKKDEQHLYKHCMHLIRLYLMAIDILQKQHVITYREKEHDLLINIRQGKLTLQEILKIKDELEIKMQEVFQSTLLPDKPDYDAINHLMIKIYKQTYGIG